MWRFPRCGPQGASPAKSARREGELGITEAPAGQRTGHKMLFRREKRERNTTGVQLS